jgi:photosystem I reaction center PsaK
MSEAVPVNADRVLQIMVASTTAFLAAGKFGLAPTVKRGTDAACKLQDRPNAAGLISNDPSGEQNEPSV